MKTIEFGVKCSNFNLMKAFKEECEAMGWNYQWEFTEFNYTNVGIHSAMYFTDDWHGNRFGFALTDLSRICPFFQLPQDWDKAVEHAKKAINTIPVAKLPLNGRYEAIVDYSSKTVEVGCQSFSFDKINELTKLINKQ